MNLDSDTPAGLRRAALALHSLRADDRGWLLQQLPQAQQQALGELLVELTELGIAPDAGVIRAALNEDAGKANTTTEDARALCLVLAKEAPALQSLLLAALPERERAAVLLHWPHELLARPSAVSGQAWTPALRDAVMQSWRGLAQAHEERAS